jgi:hypothetical protein
MDFKQKNSETLVHSLLRRNVMTYKDRFVVEVKCGGKILRVKDGVVYLPFGSEYSIYLKNLNSKRASVNVSIDGSDVLDNHSLILDANESSELKGFLNGTTAKNRFKFIQKTKEIQEHRGDKIDDGLIRVEFAFEKPQKTIIHEHHHHHNYYNSDPFHWNYGGTFTGNSSDSIYRSVENSGDVRGMNLNSVTAESKSPVTFDSLGVAPENSQPLVDEGITVKGSEINQQFRYSAIGELEESEVIIISLKGETQSNKIVQQPIMVKTKIQCSTCGRKSNSSAKFCSNCGTFLEI